MTLLAAAGGLWLAGRVIAPVRELARAVAQAPAENPPRLTAEDQPHDELGELTRSFDRYLSRLSAFIERERTFAADASHELRTPLAVISGAAEVLAEDPTGTVDALVFAMERALFDEPTREQLIERGYTRPPLFTWELAARKLISCFPRARDSRRIRA